MFSTIKRNIEFWLFTKTFSKKFYLYVTTKEDELKEIFHIRYLVYCVERGYLDEKDYPNKLESDEYDAKSIHFILRDRNDKLAASVRLILNSDLGFPIEKYHRLDVHTPQVSREKIAEVSRLIVAKAYRKKFLLLALMKGLFVYTRSMGITHVYVVLDEQLAPALRNIGISIKKIGPESVYQGITTPYIIDIDELVEAVKRSNRNFYRYLTSGAIINNNGEEAFTFH